MHMYIDIKSTRSFQVNQILICISILFWFHKYHIWFYTTMAVTTLPHPTHGCALKGSSVAASLRSPENTSQPRSDSSVLEPNTSSRCSPSLGASFSNTWKIHSYRMQSITRFSKPWLHHMLTCIYRKSTTTKD